MRLQEMEAALREIVAGLEPETLSADAAVSLVDTFVAMEKLVTAGKALAARRVADSNLWRGAGERSAAHWLARRGLVGGRGDGDAGDRGTPAGASRGGPRRAGG